MEHMNEFRGARIHTEQLHTNTQFIQTSTTTSRGKDTELLHTNTQFIPILTATISDVEHPGSKLISVRIEIQIFNWLVTT